MSVSAFEMVSSTMQRGCLLLLCLLTCIASADTKGPQIPRGKGDACVADTDFMRRNHMHVLLHQRDETVIQGIRDEPFSLVECVDCHTQTTAAGEPIRIDAEGQFCDSCHTYAAVKIDCFGCHAALPDQALNTIETDQTESAQILSPTFVMLALYRHEFSKRF